MSDLRKGWISQLCSQKETVRARAAAQIYAVGRSLADQAVRGWWRDAKLAQLLSSGRTPTVGIAVKPETFAKIRESNGWPRLAEVPTEQDASEFELHFGDVALDVLTSREPEGSGAIAKFLLKFGEGIQQVEFRCRDVDRATEILRDRLGISPIYPATRPGADGTRVNFFLVPTADSKKVLIELYEVR
jgi:hypothetical protein